MMSEELQLLNKINQKLKSLGMKSRLQFIFVGGLTEGIVTEWGFQKDIKEESAAANTLISEEVRDAIEMYTEGLKEEEVKEKSNDKKDAGKQDQNQPQDKKK